MVAHVGFRWDEIVDQLKTWHNFAREEEKALIAA
jgi:hypothetical protein